MLPVRDVQGRIYHVGSKPECLELGLSPPVGLDCGRDRMDLVLDIVPRKFTSKSEDSSEYVPISPTRKKGYAIQPRSQTHFGWYHGKFGR
ncbi:hypothetical protein BDZ45DRAFT_747689 [Acephala macrosclerotiorum]|nr:hypothetical protein BDZ45DRAFT_747689 [Acephala macrosclerotiorum]